jgi:hypothetical protein
VSQMYGEPAPPKPVEREVLTRHLADCLERIEQINFILSHIPADDFQAQELRSELQIHKAQVADLKRTLNPPPIDQDLVRRQRESLRQQAEEMARTHAPVPESVLAERRENARKRRTEMLDLQEAEARAVLMHQLGVYERAGEWSQAKLTRIAITNLRRDLEQRFPP